MNGSSAISGQIASQRSDPSNMNNVITALEASGDTLFCDFAVRRLLLASSCADVSNWRPNNDEFGLCTTGNALVSVVDFRGRKQNFVVASGDMFFFPRGRVDTVLNLGGAAAEILVAKRASEVPEAAGAGALGQFISGTEANDDHNGTKLRLTKVRIAGAQSSGSDTLPCSPPSFHRALPRLQNLAIYSLRLERGIATDWLMHRDSNELSYVFAGRGRITIAMDDGRLDMFRVEEGDVFCVPEGRRYSIEALGDRAFQLVAILDKTRLRSNQSRALTSLQVGGAVSLEFSIRRRCFERSDI